MESLLLILREVDDPRDVNIRHPLPSILFIALAATLSGARTCVGIADFADANEAELAGIVDLPHGAPEHDCFSRVFRMLDPDSLETVLRRFAAALRRGMGLGPAKGVIAVDGKRLRRGCDLARKTIPPLMVAVWDTETRLSLAARGNTGGNEVAAALEALKTVALKGCTVTGDALHCHPAMARAVMARGGDYLIKLKGNHGPLFRTAQALFAPLLARGAPPPVPETGPGRRESRRGWVRAVPADAPSFPGLKAPGCIETAHRNKDGDFVRTVHYAAMSRRTDAAAMMETVRKHWSVENRLHWQLDVSLREDDSRVRKDHGPGNLSVIRRMALDMLRAHPDKRSIARKITRAAWSKAFFFELFTYMR